MIKIGYDVAQFYCEMSGRYIITEEDLAYAICYLLLKTVRRPDLQIDNLDRCLDELYEPLVNELQELDDPIDFAPFREAPSDVHATIKNINEANQEWNDYKPPNELTLILKECVNNFITQLNKFGIDELPTDWIQ